MKDMYYEDLFSNVDVALRDLAKSDSSIEVSSHIRQEFENVLQHINVLKVESGNGRLLNNSSWYFAE